MEGWQTNSFVMYGRLANKQFCNVWKAGKQTVLGAK